MDELDADAEHEGYLLYRERDAVDQVEAIHGEIVRNLTPR